MQSAGRYVLLDVFTETALEGNQLAVFPEPPDSASEGLQRLARELNLSETVFVLAPEHGGDARVRIFTPTAELPFAGHPVLGTAVALGIERELQTVTLETGAGAVAVALRDMRARGGYGTMLQPIPSWQPYTREDELLAALGVERSGLPIEVYVNGPRHVYVELDYEQAVAALAPDLRALGALGELGVSCFAGTDGRWRTRMFAPGLGVDEDPATGSAAGPLAVHLARHGRIAFGQGIEIRQGIELGRPSLLRARALGTAAAIERVEVGGSAVVVAHGEFL
jgi:trans-2,3-dihydro-3-hydroxyanthranilate isomerase